MRPAPGRRSWRPPSRDMPRSARVGNPLRVVEIPLHGLADAGLESLRRTPAQFAFDLARIDGVAAVMARAVRDMGDQACVAALGRRPQLVEQGADRAHDVDVGLLVPAADVVGLAWRAARQHLADRAAVVGHVQPVAHVEAIAVHRQRLAGQGIDDHQRNQLLRELPGAVVVRAVGRQHRQAVGVMPGAHEVVAGGLARRVRAVRLVGLGFGKGRILRAERAIDLVRADVQEAERGLHPGLERRAMGACGLQQRKRALDVGAHEGGQAVDGAVNMAFGREMHDRTRSVLGEQAIDQGTVADVPLHEDMARIAPQRGERFRRLPA